MAVSIDQLHAFIMLAETGHFSRAAERLKVSKSSLSSNIQRLETLLGVRLFDRHTRGCNLTKAGLALLDSAHRMVQEWKRIETCADDFQKFGKRRLALAAPTSLCAGFLPPLLRDFLIDNPEVRLELRDVAEHEVQELVRSGFADMGIVSHTEMRSELVATSLFADDYILALPAKHRLTSLKQVEWHHLASELIIGPMKGDPMRKCLDDTLAEKGITLSYAYEVSQPGTMLGLMQANFGVTVLPASLLPLIRLNKLEARNLVSPSIARNLVLIKAKGRKLDSAVTNFYNRLKNLGRINLSIQ